MQPVQISLTPSHRMCCHCPTSLSSHSAHTCPFFRPPLPHLPYQPHQHRHTQILWKKEAYHSPSFPPRHHHTKQPHPQPRLLCITPPTPTPSTSLSHRPRQLARKTDITSALKVLPIRPDLWRFFGLSRRGHLYFAIHFTFWMQKYPKNILFLL